MIKKIVLLLFLNLLILIIQYKLGYVLGDYNFLTFHSLLFNKILSNSFYCDYYYNYY